jgi:LPS-assembly lipoprotein
MRSSVRTIATFFLLALLTSCGFHLRGEVPLAAPLKRMYLQSPDPYGELARNLRLGLEAAGVHLTESKDQAAIVLEILNEKTTQQLLSVGGTQQTRQYNLILAVTFQLTSPKGNIVMPPQTVSDTQALTVQADQVLGGSNEQNNLYQQMRQDIVFTLLNRLSSQSARAQVMKVAP